MKYTSEQVGALTSEIDRLIMSISRATVTIPWEAGYGPEYVPIAGDPEQSIKDLIAVIESRVRKETAMKCYGMSPASSDCDGFRDAIRKEFGL